MKVSELIEKLKKCEPNVEVCVLNYWEEQPVSCDSTQLWRCWDQDGQPGVMLLQDCDTISPEVDEKVD